MENDPYHHVNTPPHHTHLIKLPPLHMRAYMRHMFVGKQGLSAGSYPQQLSPHRLVCPVTSLTQPVRKSPPTHSPHHPQRATGVAAAPPPMPMHIEYVAIGKHRRRISGAPTPHTAHQIPFCAQSAGETTPTSTSTPHHPIPILFHNHSHTCART
jgi:hypothetical protein